MTTCEARTEYIHRTHGTMYTVGLPDEQAQNITVLTIDAIDVKVNGPLPIYNICYKHCYCKSLIPLHNLKPQQMHMKQRNRYVVRLACFKKSELASHW